MDKIIKSIPYPIFSNKTQWPQQLVEDFLVRGARHIFVGTYGAAKSSLSLDLIGSILSQRDWLDRFKIKAPNPVVFYISQDAADPDLKNLAYKVLRKYFQPDKVEHVKLLNARFHIVAGQEIKLPEDAAAVIEMVRTTLAGWDMQGRLEPLAEDERAKEIIGFGDSAIVLKEPGTGDPESPAEEDVPVDEETADEYCVDFTKFDIVMVYDSARQVHGAEESSSNEMNEVSKALAQIERATGATSIVLQHENRRHEYKGDTVIMDSAQQAYQFTCAPKCKNDPIRTIDVKIEKNRGLNVRPFGIGFAWTGLETGDHKIEFTYGGESEAGESTERRKQEASKVIKADPMMAAAERLYDEYPTVRGLQAAMKVEGFNVSKDGIGKLIKGIKARRALVGGGAVEATG